MNQKSLEYFIWEFLWRHSRATLARLCHLNPLSFNHGLKSRCQEPKKINLSRAKSDHPKGTPPQGPSANTVCVSSEILAAKQDRHQKHHPPRSPQAHNYKTTTCMELIQKIFQNGSHSPYHNLPFCNVFLTVSQKGRKDLCLLLGAPLSLENLLLSQLSLGKSSLMIIRT